MRGFAAGLVLLALAPGFAHSGDSKPGVFTSDDGRYRATFPGNPKTETKEIATPAGAVKMTTDKFDAGRDLVVSVTVATYPEGFKDLAPKTVLDGVRDGLKGVDGSVKSDGEVTLEANGVTAAGREFRVEAGRNAVRCRAFLVGNRLYQVMATGTKPTIDSKVAEEFLKSFELLPEK